MRKLLNQISNHNFDDIAFLSLFNLTFNVLLMFLFVVINEVKIFCVFPLFYFRWLFKTRKNFTSLHQFFQEFNFELKILRIESRLLVIYF